MPLRNTTGFTLIEMILVVAVIGILAAAIVPSYSKVRRDARDTERVAVVENLKKAIELYKQNNGHYPDVAGPIDGHWNYFDANDSCTTLRSDLKADFADSGDFISILYPNYFSKPNWTPPLGDLPDLNCRYIIPQTSSGPGAAAPDTLKEIQQYFLHCGVEGKNAGADRDGGTNPGLYEIFGPKHWLCIEKNNCGNGIIDTGEACDAGSNNGPTCPATCSLSCTIRSCSSGGCGLCFVGQKCCNGQCKKSCGSF